MVRCALGTYVGLHSSLTEKLHYNVSQRTKIVDPFNDTAFLVQRSDSIGLDVWCFISVALEFLSKKVQHTQPPLACLHISLQEAINHVIEFHETLILAKIVFGLAKRIVNFTVRSSDANLSWLLKGVEDLRLIENG